MINQLHLNDEDFSSTKQPHVIPPDTQNDDGIIFQSDCATHPFEVVHQCNNVLHSGDKISIQWALENLVKLTSADEPHFEQIGITILRENTLALLLKGIAKDYLSDLTIQTLVISLIENCVRFLPSCENKNISDIRIVHELVDRFGAFNIICGAMLSFPDQLQLQEVACAALASILDLNSNFVSELVVEYYGLLCFFKAMVNFPSSHVVQCSGCRFFRGVGYVKDQLIANHSTMYLGVGGINEILQLLNDVRNRFKSQDKSPEQHSSICTEATEVLRLWSA